MGSPVEVTLQHLTAVGVKSLTASQWVGPLNAAFYRFEINTKERIALFLAQALHESANLTKLVEDLRYKPERAYAIFASRFDSITDAAMVVAQGPQAFANRVYANKGGNGSEASGDGWKYRGRGPFQLTLRDNYLDAMMALDRDYVENPDLVAEPFDGALTAAHYYAKVHGNTFADTGNFIGLTKAINKAMLGYEDRFSRLARLLTILTV
jgi:putative chitinase